MRIGSFNVMHGRSLSDGLVDADRFHDAVARLDADILAVQEVDVGQPRSGGFDQAAAVARAVGAGDGNWHFEPTLYGTPGVGWRAAGGRREPGEPAYGIVLASRLPVRELRFVELGRAPLRSPVAAFGTKGRRVMLLDDEPRAAIIAVVEAPPGPMTVAATHLSFVPGWNAVQLCRLVRALAGAPEPVVLLGDLNLPGRSAALVSRMRPLIAAPTFPALSPRVQLDHVLARGGPTDVVAAGTRRAAISDHLAVLVDLADAGPVPRSAPNQ